MKTHRSVPDLWHYTDKPVWRAYVVGLWLRHGWHVAVE